MEFKCIIFDCDGVLVDSEAISARVFRDMALELGLDIEFETVLEQITGTSMKENLKFFGDRIRGGLPPDFETEFRRRSYEAFKTDLKPISGIHALLDKIKVPIGVASSGPAEKIRLNLTTTNLIHKFEGHIFSSYDIGSWKPEPEIYLYAARKMGFNPADCAVIEDSKPGIMAAKAGGFQVFGFAHGKNKPVFEALGATVFQDMSALGKMLGLE
jgi:HAD superfamily hydrolase (TIGR01509 family)